MDPRIAPIYSAVRMNSRLLVNCFADLDEEQVLWRHRGTNNMAFLALHLTDARFFVAALLGVELDNPYADRFGEVDTLDDIDELPPIDEVLEVWGEVSGHLEQLLADADAEVLDADSSFAFPVADGSVLGGLVFLLCHESYHIGQLGLLRRQQGAPGMSYD